MTTKGHKVRFTMYECEHDGDVSHYLRELEPFGLLEVVRTDLNYEAETCEVVAMVEDCDRIWAGLRELF